MSSKSMTPVSSISEITTNTTMVALMKLDPRNGRLMVGLEPQIHRNIASSTRAAMIHSLCDGGPIAANSPALQVTISGLSFTSGRQTFADFINQRVVVQKVRALSAGNKANHAQTARGDPGAAADPENYDELVLAAIK